MLLSAINHRHPSNRLVNEVAEQSLGMPMIFQCVSDAKEWLRTKVGAKLADAL